MLRYFVRSSSFFFTDLVKYEYQLELFVNTELHSVNKMYVRNQARGFFYMKEKEDMCSMTASEYKEKIGKIVEGMEDLQSLHRIYIFASKRQKNENVYIYGNMIIEMIDGLQNEQFLRQIYTIIKKHIEKGGG